MYNTYALKINKRNYNFFTPIKASNYDLNRIIPITSFMRLIVTMFHTNITYRRGFYNTCVLDSISSHMYRIIMYLFYTIDYLKLKLDTHMCIIYAMLHDIPEVYTGDTIPNDNVNKHHKHNLEQKVFVTMFQQNAQLIKHYNEYIQQNNKEAQFVHLLDKYDFYYMLLVEYKTNTQSSNYNKQLKEKIESCRHGLQQETTIIINDININEFLMNIENDILHHYIQHIQRIIN